MCQPPLWPDGWEAEADRKAGIDPDEQAHLDLHAPRYSHARSRPVRTIEPRQEYL